MKSSKSRYADVLRVLEKQVSCAEIAGADQEFVACFRSVISFLSSRNEDQVNDIFKGNNARDLPLREDPLEELSNVSLERAEEIIDTQAVPRRFLERLAMQRFSLSSGELARLSKRDVLLERLRTLVANERTHEAIGRVASNVDRPGASGERVSGSFVREHQDLIGELLRLASQMLDGKGIKAEGRLNRSNPLINAEALYSPECRAIIIAAQFKNGSLTPVTLLKTEIKIEGFEAMKPEAVPADFAAESGFIWLGDEPLRLSIGETRKVAWYFSDLGGSIADKLSQHQPCEIRLTFSTFPDRDQSLQLDLFTVERRKQLGERRRPRSHKRL